MPRGFQKNPEPRSSAEADQLGFLRVQGEVEQARPFLQVMQERLRFMLVLEADDRIVRIADHDRVSGKFGGEF